MTVNTIIWNEEKKIYEVSKKIEMTEEEVNKLLDSIFE